MVDIETLAALSTEPGLMFLTDSDCLPIGMASTLHISLRFLTMIARRWRGYDRFKTSTLSFGYHPFGF